VTRLEDDGSALAIFAELVGAGVEKGASVLNTMLQAQIRMNVPFVRALTLDELTDELTTLGGARLSSVDLGFRGDFTGLAQLIFPAETASKLVAAVTGDDTVMEEFDAIHAGTLCEVGNIVLNGVMGSMSNRLRLHLSYSVPNYVEGTIRELLAAHHQQKATVFLLARTRFSVESLEIDGDIVLFFEVASFAELLELIECYDGRKRNSEQS